MTLFENGTTSHFLKDLIDPRQHVKVIIHGVILEYMTPELYNIKNGKKIGKELNHFKYVFRCNGNFCCIYFESTLTLHRDLSWTVITFVGQGNAPARHR